MRYLLVLFLTFWLSACASWFVDDREPTPQEDLAAAEITFQGVQNSIQRLVAAQVITPAMAPCISDANAGLHAGLLQSRGAVQLGLKGAGVIVSSFNAALLSMRGVIARIEGGTYSCQLSQS